VVGTLSRILTRATAALLLLAVIGGLPVALVHYVGWPLPTAVPDLDQLTGWLHTPVTDTVIINLLAIAAWLLWAAFIHAIGHELLDTWRGMPTRTSRRNINPLRPAAAALITAITLGTLLTSGATAGPTQQPATIAVAQAQPAQAQPATEPLQTIRPAAAGAITVHVGQERYTYVVKKGDYLYKIAGEWLGDSNRWPEICKLNWHRHFPTVGGTLHDCDLIYPGWDLILPEDASPPANATPAPPPTPEPEPEPEPVEPPTAEPTPSPSPSADTGSPPPSTLPPHPDGVVDPADLPPVSPPSPSDAASPSPAATDSGTPPATTGPEHTEPGDNDQEDNDQEDTEPAGEPESSGTEGMTLPGGSYLPWALAAALIAAAAMVWLQRQRRFRPGPTSDPQTSTRQPPVVEQVRRGMARDPAAPRLPADLVQRAVAVPKLPTLPPGGIGLVGDGAHAAARAAIVTTLASGGPRDPDRQGEVVIDGTTLTTLIGADAASLGPWPRLHIADDLDHALAIVETRLLHRSRILDEHAATDLDTLRQRAPDEEPLPPVLLITETPPPGARMRARATLGLGTGLDVAALLLGEWGHGTTLRIDPTGHTQHVAGPQIDTLDQRMAVLDTDTTVQMFATLREAHTGEPTTTAADTSADQPPPDADAPQPVAGPAPANRREPGPAAAPKVRLRVLGNPQIENITRPGRPLRAKALELAVYLACHPGGKATREIGEYLCPEARLREADQRVHTYASNLRHVLTRAGAPHKDAYLIRDAARYRLDPVTVEVDLWQLRDLLHHAAIASGDNRRHLLEQACNLYAAPLADGCKYEWIEPYRQQARQLVTRAHLQLAEDLLPDDPQRASDLLDQAIGHDRYNEALYCAAMHTRHALGDHDGIRNLLRALTRALADIGAEPSDSTVELADQLRASLEHR
jgi:DNA-binding SARP family transcriptional activator